MVRAFAVLQERRKDSEEQVVSQANWNQLVRLVQPDIRNAHRELLWSVLDHQNQGCIGNTHTHTWVNTHSHSSLSSCPLSKGTILVMVNVQGSRQHICGECEKTKSSLSWVFRSLLCLVDSGPSPTPGPDRRSLTGRAGLSPVHQPVPLNYPEFIASQPVGKLSV